MKIEITFWPIQYDDKKEKVEIGTWTGIGKFAVPDAEYFRLRMSQVGSARAKDLVELWSSIVPTNVASISPVYFDRASCLIDSSIEKYANVF